MTELEQLKQERDALQARAEAAEKALEKANLVISDDVHTETEIEKLCASVLGQAYVDGDSMSVPGPLGCVSEVVARCVRAEKACAEKDDALLMADTWFDERTQHTANEGPRNIVLNAFSTDAGKDYIHKDRVKPIVEALQSTLDEFNDRYDGAPDSRMQWMAYLMRDIEQALARAKALRL